MIWIQCFAKDILLFQKSELCQFSIASSCSCVTFIWSFINLHSCHVHYHSAFVRGKCPSQEGGRKKRKREKRKRGIQNFYRNKSIYATMNSRVLQKTLLCRYSLPELRSRNWSYDGISHLILNSNETINKMVNKTKNDNFYQYNVSSRRM